MFIQSITHQRRAHLFLPKTETIAGLVIHAPGMPGYPKPSELYDYYHAQGYAVLRPMWSGSGESMGVFSTAQCLTDLLDRVTYVRSGVFQTIIHADGTSEQITIAGGPTILAGTSFGARIAGLSAYHDALADIDTVHLLSPMWSPHRYRDDADRVRGVDEHRHILSQAFPRSWHVEQQFRDDMRGIGEYHPQPRGTQKKSLTVIHGRDDTVCPLSMGERCARDLDGRLVVVDGGHSSKMDVQQVIDGLKL